MGYLRFVVERDGGVTDFILWLCTDESMVVQTLFVIAHFEVSRVIV
jgi:hypothetical protein